jgi:hypothetical protein
LPRGNFRVTGGKFKRYISTHAMSDHDRPYQVKLLAKPCQIVGEDSHRVVLMRSVAFSMSTQIDRDDTLRSTKNSAWGAKEL